VARHAQTAIDFHRRRGDVVAIITATNRFVTEPITKLLGLDYLIATDLQTVNGGYTGAIAGIPCFREGKIARARDFLAELGVRTDHITFYSDSHNDLPLLQWADQAVVVDPDPRLEAAAQQAGWSIISLRGETSPF
jgi:HAD superfamily phosphoserine phosphatase-like hydrolase